MWCLALARVALFSHAGWGWVEWAPQSEPPLSALLATSQASLQTKALDQSPPLVHLQPFPATSAPRETPAGFPPHLLERKEVRRFGNDQLPRPWNSPSSAHCRILL